MAFKIVYFLACVALAQANWISPVAHGSLEYNHVPEYSYSYGVNDPHTGDSKSQQETRHGDLVRGQYSLIESDGSRRTVDYAADGINGFNAVVRRDGLSQHGAPVAVAVAHATPVAIAAPAVYVAAPSVTYSRSSQTIVDTPTVRLVHGAPLSIAAHGLAAPVTYGSGLGYSAGVASLGLAHGSNLLRAY